MSVRGTFAVQIQCHKCKQKGVLHFFEGEHPYMSNRAPEIESVEGKFHAKPMRKGKIEVVCLICKIIIYNRA